MEDYILRVTAGDGSIRGFIATTRNTVQRAYEIHQTSPTATAALGRLLTAGSIMGAMLKDERDLITLGLTCDGPVKGLLVTSDSSSRVKGYAYSPEADVPLRADGKLDVGALIGNGALNVIKDLGMKEPYIGQVPLVTGEIGDDLTEYFAKSEQTPSAVALGVLIDKDCSVKRAGGFVIQLMPGATEYVITELEDKLKQLKPVTELLEQRKTPEDIAEMIFGDMGVIINGNIPVEYYCNCTKERVEKALISLGREELEKIIREDGKAELHCHFCNKNYNFDKNALETLMLNI